MNIRIVLATLCAIPFALKASENTKKEELSLSCFLQESQEKECKKKRNRKNSNQSYTQNNSTKKRKISSNHQHAPHKYTKKQKQACATNAAYYNMIDSNHNNKQSLTRKDLTKHSKARLPQNWRKINKELFSQKPKGKEKL